ncbi:MAG: hypothetical protein A3E80_03395 [Chlamydiae bacterium RIFCSPHIGHO2_12_FULL_49_9]|nr:MAG: hypothetical protein A3E80_03395 [Chlamydiae bacterium RIFCSPHIGHO2_12_FULL_49_9]
MRKALFLVAIAVIFPVLAFCQQMTWIGNRWACDSQLVSIRQWGGNVYSVYCQNPCEAIENQRWVIVYETN